MSDPAKPRQIGKHACEACRKSKIRCFTDTLEQHGQCRRCYGQGLACEWKEISKTRVRKRTDVRVAELEKQMMRMSAAMQDMETKTPAATGSDVSAGTSTSFPLTRDQPQSVVSGHEHSSLDVPYGLPSVVSGGETKHASNQGSPRISVDPVYFSESAPSGPVTTHEQLPMYRFPIHKRGELLHVFREMLLPSYPITWVAPEIPVQVLEGSRRFALNSMITAACILSEPESFLHVHKATVKLLAHYVFILGHKSLDLVHALLITSTWSGLPENLSNINIFQWTQIAGTMAVELGLLGRTSKQAQAQELTHLTGVLSDPLMESVRTSLGTYLTCSRIAVSFRRQILLSSRSSITVLMDAFSRCVTRLEDRRLLAWLRLQLIVEDIESMKQGAEIRAEATSLEHAAFKDDFELFSDRLKEWEMTTGRDLMNESLKADFFFYRSKLHELAIYFENDTRQLELSELATASEGDFAGVGTSLNPLYVRTLLSFIDDCHSILNIILAADTQAIRAMPILTILRTPYAFKALAMLEKRASRAGDAIGKIIDQQTLKWQYFARNVSQILEGASQGGLYVVPKAALRMRDSTVEAQRLKSIAEANDQLRASERAPAGGASWNAENPEYPAKGFSMDMEQLLFPSDSMDFDFVMEPWENELWTTDIIAFR